MDFRRQTKMEMRSTRKRRNPEKQASYAVFQGSESDSQTVVQVEDRGFEPLTS
jgi:hypothetical protein